MDRSNIEKIAREPEDKLLLAKPWAKTSPREQEMAKFLFGEGQGIFYFGGHEDAERKKVVFLPEYLEEGYLMDADSPIVCLRASFYQGDTPSHRDFLGALMGSGISREAVGDICVGTKEIRDTLASLRLDSVISSGFRIGRNLAVQHINAGRAAIDGLPCEKPDKAVEEGAKISVRGLGKIRLTAVNGQTKKKRISVVIHRYV